MQGYVVEAGDAGVVVPENERLVEIPMDLQTVMATAQRMMIGPSEPPPESQLLEAVAGRLRRREMLMDSRKKVMVLLSEAALASRLVSDARCSGKSG